MSGGGLEEQVLRREKFAVELRKQKRLEQSSKRRRMAASSGQSVPELGELLQRTFPDLYHSESSDLERLKKLGLCLSATQPADVILQAVMVIRGLVASTSTLPIDLLIQAGLAPPLLRLTQSGSLDIMREASWAVCNLLSGSHECTEVIVSLGGLQVLMNLLGTEDALLLEHGIWGLGNMVGDCSEYRKMALDAGVLEKILAIGKGLMGKVGQMDLMRIVSWAILNLLSGKTISPSHFMSILPDLQAFCQVEDLSLRKDLLWILAYNTDGEEEICERVLEVGLAGFALQALRLNDDNLVMPATRILGNIAAGNNLLTQQVLELGLLDVLLPLVQHRDYTIRKEIQWILSNITAGTSDQRSLYLAHSICQEALFGFKDPTEAVRLEASWVYYNLTTAGTPTDLLRTFDLGIILLFQDRFHDDPRLVRNLLLIIYKLLEAGYRMSQSTGNPQNPVAEQLVASGCYEEMEKLTHTDEGQNSEIALHILDMYFSVDGQENRFE